MAPPDPIHFVREDLGSWADILGLDVPPAPDEVADRLVGAVNAWIIGTYLVLKRRGWDVRLTSRLVPGGLCVMHADTYIRLAHPHDSFLVVLRLDRPPVLLADRQIVQNPALADDRRAYFVPVWPQPGLIERDGSRGDRIDAVGYLGRAEWLAPAFRSPAFRHELGELGMQLVVREHEWWDYSDVDAVLAVRDCHRDLLRTKPPSKLTNAWLAGCPALLGDEFAYRALRRSELDYFEVRSPEEALGALARLRDDGLLFREMVANGRQRAEEFTQNALAERWETVLSDAIVPAFERWRRRSRARRALRRARWALFGKTRDLVWYRFHLKVGTLSPRACIYRSRSRTMKAVAAVQLVRSEGLSPVVRAGLRRLRS